MRTHNENDETRPNCLIGKLAYQVGIMHEKLNAIKDDLIMGANKEAISKTNVAIEYMKSYMIPESYLQIEGVEINESAASNETQ